MMRQYYHVGMLIASVLLPLAAAPAPGTAQTQPATASRARPAMAAIRDNPRLPRVLLIGDSISIGYTLPVRRGLDGVANVHRIPENGGPTTRGLEQIEQWLGKDRWDVIHFNWGLHDLKRLQPDRCQAPLDEYEANLKRLVARLKKTGATLIWATTTPVPTGADLREPADVARYNDVALRIMRENDIMVNDLHAFALPRLADIQLPRNVHYTPAGSEKLAEPVIASIRKALQTRRTAATRPAAARETATRPASGAPRAGSPAR